MISDGHHGVYAHWYMYVRIARIISVKDLLPFAFSQYNCTDVKPVPRLVLKQIL